MFKKVLVWLTLSSKGISTRFIGTAKGPAITIDIYINKCSSKLRLFVEEHHADDEYIFWRYLTTHMKQHNGFSNKRSN